MKSKLAVILVLLGALQACNSPGNAPTQFPSAAAPAVEPLQPQGEEVVATVHGQAITMKQLMAPLIEGYGLNDLLLLVKLNLAQQELASAKMFITPVDIETEKQLTLMQLKRAAKRINNMGAPATQGDDEDSITPDETQKLLDQVLSQEHLSKPEFEIIMQTNACLRKIDGPAITEKITDKAVHDQFDAEYGQKVRTRYIVCRTREEVGKVQRELAAGKEFADVATAHSLDPVTSPNGGELFPFTRQDNRIPDIIRQAAFSQKDGQVSDVIEYKEFLYIIKTIGRIEPALARFEDYKDAVRKDLIDQLIQAAMEAQRQKLADMAMTNYMLSIKDPVMALQFQARLDERNGQLRDKAKISAQMERERKTTTQPGATTNPFQNPAASMPTAPTETEAAPATMPAAR